MGSSNSTTSSRGSKEVSDQQGSNDDVKLKRKYDKVEKLWQEAERQAGKREAIFEEVDKDSKSGFADLPPTNPTLAELQNPFVAYRLYHKQLRGLMRAFIPKGKDGKDFRDQINLFLKEGNATGRDGKQAYTKMLVEAINTFKQWVNDYNGDQLFELFYRFRKLNKRFNPKE